MPREEDETPVCSPEKLECVEEALITVEETAFDTDHETATNCQCLPSCTDIEYPHKVSFSSLLKADLLHLPDEVKGN